MSILDRLVRPLRTGVVTSRYPDEPPVLAAATRQLPIVDPATCTRDAACVRVCPTSAVTLTAAAWIVDAGRCVFCGECARACPVGAIAMRGGVTLAAISPAGLLHATPLPAAPSGPTSGSDPTSGSPAPEWAAR